MIELIPAIDIIGGRCVRLARGDYNSRKVYSSNPVDVAREMEDHGIRRLHVVDLDGAASRHVVNHRTLAAIASATRLVIDFGGGVKTDEDLRIALDSGARMVTAGSLAVTDPDRLCHWLDTYGPDCIILGADVKDGRIATHGWQEKSAYELFDFLARYMKKGVTRVICTDIQRDGMLAGPSIGLYQDILHRCPGLEVIASGGVSGLADILALQEAGVPAVIFGKAIYEGRITWQEIESLLMSTPPCPAQPGDKCSTYP